MAATSLREAFAPWRSWFLDQAEVARRIGRVEELVQGSADRVDEGLRLAREILPGDPYNSRLHRMAARACAARGDAEAYGQHLAICVSMHDLDADGVRADPLLRGALSPGQVDQALTSARGYARSDRTRDYCFDEIAPRSGRFTTTLHWPAAHQASVEAAYARFARLSALTEDRYVFPDRGDRGYDAAESYAHHVGAGTMLLESESMPGAFCPTGVTLQFAREVAPFVEDVRFFFFDQVSPLHEIWIVDHAFYIRRHPIHVDDLVEVARYLDDLLLREGIADAYLGGYVAEQLAAAAGGSIQLMSSPSMSAAAIRQQAEDLMARVVRHDGEEPPYLRAQLRRHDGDLEGVIASLERTIERLPTFRKPMLELAHLYLDRGRTEDALAMTERIVAMGDRADEDAHLLRARALDLLGRRKEALAAYRRHAAAIASYSGVLLRDANQLLAEGNHEAARLLFRPIVRAGHGTGLAAELGLARCAEALGDRDRARVHHRRVLDRAPRLKRAHADTPSMLSAIMDTEAAARAWIDGNETAS